MDSQGHPKTFAEFAKILNGKVSSGWINIAGPNHSSNDYSLGIKPDPNTADGFLVHSFAGDDPVECKTYVLEKLKSKKISSVSLPLIRHQPMPTRLNSLGRYGTMPIRSPGRQRTTI